jgi:hypothetical protein
MSCRRRRDCTSILMIQEKYCVVSERKDNDKGPPAAKSVGKVSLVFKISDEASRSKVKQTSLCSSQQKIHQLRTFGLPSKRKKPTTEVLWETLQPTLLGLRHGILFCHGRIRDITHPAGSNKRPSSRRSASPRRHPECFISYVAFGRGFHPRGKLRHPD